MNSLKSILSIFCLIHLAVASIAHYDAFSLPEHLQLLKRDAEAEEEASYQCHSDCGYSILAVYSCSDNGDETGPFDQSCLCSSNSTFMSLMPACYDCGWCLYTDYWPYLETAIASCSTIPITPTGTTCSPTTSYSVIALEENNTVGNSSSVAVSSGSVSSIDSDASSSIASITSSSDDSSASASADSSASGSASASSGASSTVASTTAAGMGSSLKVSGIIGIAGLAFLMI